MYATTTDVADLLLRPLTDAEQRSAERLLRFAAAAVRQQVPLVDARLAAGTLDQDLVASVVAAVVVRVLRNPEGLKSQTESAGPFSHTRVQGQPAGFLRLLPEEIVLLRPTEQDEQPWSGTIAIGRRR